MWLLGGVSQVWAEWVVFLMFPLSSFYLTMLLNVQIGLFAKISLQNCPNLGALLRDGE